MLNSKLRVLKYNPIHSHYKHSLSVSYDYIIKKYQNEKKLEYQLNFVYDWGVLREVPFSAALKNLHWQETYVAKTSQIGAWHWRTSCEVLITSRHVPRRSNWSLKWVKFLSTNQFVFMASQVVQPLFSSSHYVATTSQRRRSYLGRSFDISATCWIG